MTETPPLRGEPSRAPRAAAAALLLSLYLAAGTLVALLALRSLFASGAEKSLGVGPHLALWRTAAAASLLLLLSAIILHLRRGGAGGFAVGGVARALFLHAVSGWVLCILLLQPYRRVSFLAGAALWFGVFGIAAILDALRPGWRSAKPLRALDLAATNLCAVILLLEVSLRVVAFARPSPLLAQIDRSVERYLDRTRFLPGQYRFGFPTNNRGYYDDEFAPRRPGEKRVALVGDSFAAGAVPHAFHFATVCERALGGVPVDTYGVAHARPTEYLAILRFEVVPAAPDAIVIAVFVGNDIAETPPRRGRDKLLRVLFDRDNALTYLVPVRLRRLREATRKRPDPETPVMVAQGETILGERRVEITAELKGIFPWLVDPSREEPTMDEEDFLRHETEAASAVCGADPAPYERFFPVMEEIRGAAGQIPLLVLVIPDEFQVNDALWDRITRGAGERLDRDRPQRLLMEEFRRLGIPSLDLLPALRAVPPLEDGYNHLYHLRDTHWNARGNRVAGEELAAFLRPRLE